MTGAERILEMLTAFGVLARLRQMQRPAVILADPGLIPALAEDAVPDQAHLVPVIGFETADLPGDATGPYVVVTAGDELALKQRLRRVLALRGQRVAIYGALQDLVPMAIGDDESFEPAGLEAKWESFSLTPSLIVTCTPRSGSQFVVRKFQEAGIGAPREHVRPAVISLFTPEAGERPAGTRFAPFLIGLVHHARRNGLFATKLISHFIRDLEGLLLPDERSLLEEYVRRSHILYLLRCNKLLQGLSRDRAETIDTFHLFNEDRRGAYLQRSQDWTYDYARMLREVRLINEEETYLLSWLRRTVEPSHRVPVIYESLDIEAEVSRWRGLLGLQTPESPVKMTAHVLRDERTQDYAARFAADYRNSYRSDDPSTHVAHWVTYDPLSDALQSRTDPDSMVLGG